MKSLLNQGVHELLRLAHTPVPCSENERLEYLKQAQEIGTEIKQWIGPNHHEMVGLGQNCNSSWYIKATSNKQASYPFDWIFTTPDIILDMLADDFKAFTDKSQLISHGLDAGHERYHETLFGHRNPAKLEADRKYLGRCIERWNELLESQRPVLFITTVINESDKRNRWKEGFTKRFKMPTDQKLEDFDAVIEKIESLHPKCKFLFIEQYTEQPFGLKIVKKTNNAFWLKYDAIDKNTGVQYLHSVDDEVMKTILTVQK